ncbi:MAG: hypothetical protein ACYSWZ_17220 [Planctomycetota bacterium]
MVFGNTAEKCSRNHLRSTITAGTFPILAINGPITDEELRSVVDNLVPAKEYKEE